MRQHKAPAHGYALRFSFVLGAAPLPIRTLAGGVIGIGRSLRNDARLGFRSDGRFMRRFILALLMCARLSAATGGPVEDGATAYLQRDYVTALQIWKKAATKGDVLAQHNLGYMYANAKGVPQDFSEALKWYGRAANQGYAPAQLNLGLMYANGDGVPQDSLEAIEWYSRAADQGYALAQFNLGVMYANGEGVPQDYSEAIAWYQRAADQGWPDAQHNLGVMYAEGRGVPKDFVRAYEWLDLAASRQANPQERDISIRNRDLIAKLMTAEEIAEAKMLAKQWKPK